jgi:hypothetical protein
MSGQVFFFFLFIPINGTYMPIRNHRRFDHHHDLTHQTQIKTHEHFTTQISIKLNVIFCQNSLNVS